MARLRQLHPGNYKSSGNISDEIEGIVRYLNSAELGDFTISELLAKLFDANGIFDGPVEFKFDTVDGLQFRVGEFVGVTDGFQTLATFAQLRGASGSSVGTIEGEVFHNRSDQTATAAQTVFTYAFESGEDVLVLEDGLLQTLTADYTISQVASTVTFVGAMSGGEKVTFITVRAGSVTNYRRSDLVSTAAQAVFAFVHDSDETLLVWKNGIMQQEGGANDYTTSDTSDTITFVSACSLNDKITIIVVENLSLQNVIGLMLESAYTDANGLIPFAKLALADADIPQAKINGLTALLNNRGRMFVSATTPTGATSGDLWLDTSVSPNVLKVFDGAGFILIDVGGDVPPFDVSNATNLLKVNGTGTATEWGTYDDSHLIPKTFQGAASGVASLDSTGKIPTSEIPDLFALTTMHHAIAGSVANATYTVSFVFLQKIRIDGIVTKLTSGTCSVQISVDGTPVGTTHAATGTKLDTSLGTSIEIDGSVTSKTLQLVVSSGSSPVDLDVALAIAAISA